MTLNTPCNKISLCERGSLDLEDLLPSPLPSTMGLACNQSPPSHQEALWLRHNTHLSLVMHQKSDIYVVYGAVKAFFDQMR